jgi:hypothetical protein
LKSVNFISMEKSFVPILGKVRWATISFWTLWWTEKWTLWEGMNSGVHSFGRTSRLIYKYECACAWSVSHIL